jgi:hypothetical protein
MKLDSGEGARRTTHHISSPGVTTAKEKGSEGPVQGRRRCKTLYNMGGKRLPHRVAIFKAGMSLHEIDV